MGYYLKGLLLRTIIHAGKNGVDFLSLELAGREKFFEPDSIHPLLKQLQADGWIEKTGNQYHLGTQRLEYGTLYTDKHEVVTFESSDDKLRFRVEDGSQFGGVNGDKVVAQVKGRGGKGKAGAKVISIVRRKNMYVTGEVNQSPLGYLLYPGHPSLPRKLRLLAPEGQALKVGSMIRASFAETPTPAGLPRVEYEREIGATGSREAVYAEILTHQGFPLTFPDHVLFEAERIRATQTSGHDLDAHREDFRGKLAFTIDPFDAKDHDDALSFHWIDEKTFEVGIHIADVSYYIAEQSELDKEAGIRATSVYMPNYVLPMLPEALSNDLCSLTPNSDKRAFAVIVKMDSDGNVLEHRFAETWIHCDYKFSYEEVQGILDGAEHTVSQELNLLNQLAHKLRNDRLKAGAIQFESDELSFVLDGNGWPIDLIQKLRTDSHMLIEDFMLLANRLVAEALGAAVVNQELQAGFYRIHATPDYGKLAALQSFARNHDVDISINSMEEFAASVNSQLAKPATRANKIIATMVMRSMAKAEYSPDDIGHYGLAFRNYTHFTSPIRRYPDIIVHRLLKTILFGSTFSYSHEQLKKLGKYTTDQEKRAVMAERQSVKYNQIEYLETVINDNFLGTIVSMEEYGFFVEIDKIYVEGLVHVSTLPKGYYVYDSVSQSLADVHSSSAYSLGQEVEVRVKAIDKAKRKIDFVLTEVEDNEDE